MSDISVIQDSSINLPQETLAIVLAAGQGTRMNSELPKVLFPVCGKPMVRHVVETLRIAGVNRIILVVGFREELVREEFEGESDIEFVTQHERLGTGHAVQVCHKRLAGHAGPVLIVTGDSPLIQPASVKALIRAQYKQQLACVVGSLKSDNPTGLGRIVRNNEGSFRGIVEHKDATTKQLKINEVNMSTYVFDSHHLQWSLSQLKTNNKQNEYYLTDCPSILLENGQAVDAKPVLQPCEALSVNTPEQLQLVEDEMRKLG
tara:strand:+ start:448 stop:1230 length:783 start_codon:yes stop_codon:yes gene_type:complete